VPLVAVSALCLLSPVSRAQDASDPVALVRAASWNELHASGNKTPFRFLLARQDSKGSSVKEIIETSQGDVARLLEKNGKPLPPDAEQAEKDRLNNLLAHPELQQRRFKKEQEDSKRGDEMVRLLPDAFLYTDSGVVQTDDGPAYRLTFKPNPRFEPPDREAEVYAGMAGELWINQSQKRIARIDAHLINDVDFGWGIIGRLYRGGSILVEQKDVGEHHWEQTHMVLNLTGKVMMLKSIAFQITENTSHFRPVERDLTYQRAVHLLLQAHAPGAENARLPIPTGGAEGSRDAAGRGAPACHAGAWSRNAALIAGTKRTLFQAVIVALPRPSDQLQD
jgi:hypothetical protein